MTNPATGKAAFYNALAGGSQYDPNAAQQAPLNDPANHLADIYLDPDLDYLEVLSAGQVKVIHAAIAGISPPSGLSVSLAWNPTPDDWQLVAYSDPGYVPYALVAAGSNIIWPGMPVQNNADGGARYATVYCRNGEARVRLVNTIGASSLSAIELTYTYLIFKNPPPPTGSILFRADPVAGLVQFGLGKWRSDRKYLLVASGGSPLGFSMGRTIDLNGGAPRAWRPDGTSYEPAPADLRSYLPLWAYGGALLDSGPVGAPMAYGGSYGAPASVQVQAP